MDSQKTEVKRVKRRVLCEEKEVYYKSLPRCLMFPSTGDALYEARDLTCFLEDVASLLATFTEREITQQGAWGLVAVLRLLRDKIEIGGGWSECSTGFSRWSIH
jgi:hypothetical protein